MASVVKIRCVNVSTDAEAITNIYNHYVTDTVVTFETDPVTIDEMRERIIKISSKFPYLVATVHEEDDAKKVEDTTGDAKKIKETLIGYSYANTFRSRAAYDWTVETSIILNPNFTGRTFGRQLYEKLIERLKEKGFIVAIAAITYPGNIASIKFHEKIGFKIFGKHEKCGFKSNEWHDVWFLEYRLNEPTIPPPELW